MNEMFERSLPPCFAYDLDAWNNGVAEKSRLLDCLWGELQRQYYKTYLTARYEALFE